MFSKHSTDTLHSSENPAAVKSTMENKPFCISLSGPFVEPDGKLPNNNVSQQLLFLLHNIYVL